MNVVMPTRRAAIQYAAAFLACAVAAPVFSQPGPSPQQPLIGFWSFSVEGHPTQGSLMIVDDNASAEGSLTAKIAFAPIRARVTQTDQGRQLEFETPWGSKYLALERANGVFEGTATRDGGKRNARISPVRPAVDKNARVIDFFYFGGPDCPNPESVTTVGCRGGNLHHPGTRRRG
jgi:hypothetical protein